jgi:hypothetical protein
MESWRIVWRDGFAPVLSAPGLRALADALRTDDPRLIQHATTLPLLHVETFGEPVECACPIALCGWLGDGLDTAGQVEEFWGRTCFEADQRLGEPAPCRWFLNFVDDAPRDVLRRELLSEVERALTERVAAAA